MNTPLPDHQKGTEHLAVERTFLAWVRTSISIIGLGFVVAKFGVWVRELAARLEPQVQIHSTGMSLPIGVGMMAFGGILTVWPRGIATASIRRSNAAKCEPTAA